MAGLDFFSSTPRGVGQDRDEFRVSLLGAKIEPRVLARLWLVVCAAFFLLMTINWLTPAIVAQVRHNQYASDPYNVRATHTKDIDVLRDKAYEALNLHQPLPDPISFSPNPFVRIVLWARDDTTIQAQG